MCYTAELSPGDGFDVFENNIELHYDDEWDEHYCEPTVQKLVAHFSSNGKIQFYSVTETEQQNIMVFARNAVLC